MLKQKIYIEKIDRRDNIYQDIVEKYKREGKVVTIVMIF